MFIPKFSENVNKLIKVKDVTIDGPVFNLHCKITALMLFFASAVVSMKVYVGEGPIQCITDFEESDHQKVVETFCWVNSTFSLTPSTADQNNPYKEVYRSTSDSSEELYHAYYQWVCFVLFLQAVLFYAPKWMWKHSEGALMKHLKGTEVQKLINKEERKKQKSIIANYFIERLKRHGEYTFTYWFYEILCLVNVVMQVFALDKFFGGNGTFLTYGLRELNIVSLKFPGLNTMDYIFPLQTKCTFYKYGPSGTLQNRDALCVLVLNIYNRYIYLVMWYWFLSLIFFFIVLLIYRGALLFSPWLRYFHLKTPGNNNLEHETSFVAYSLSVADWWVLYSLKSNIDPILFKDIILELFQKLSSPKAMLQESKKMLENDKALGV